MGDWLADLGNEIRSADWIFDLFAAAYALLAVYLPKPEEGTAAMDFQLEMRRVGDLGLAEAIATADGDIPADLYVYLSVPASFVSSSVLTKLLRT